MILPLPLHFGHMDVNITYLPWSRLPCQSIDTSLTYLTKSTAKKLLMLAGYPVLPAVPGRGLSDTFCLRL